MRNYGKLRNDRHFLKNGQIKMYSKKRGYYFKKKEQKRDGHALRCKKYARFVDAEAGTFWGLPLDKPWFICSFYKGEVMTEEDKKDEEIINAFMDMIKRDDWEPMEAMPIVSGGALNRLADYLPEEAIVDGLEDIDFLVVGWNYSILNALNALDKEDIEEEEK